MSPRETAINRMSEEAATLAEHIYELRGEAETPAYLGGPDAYWRWLLERLDYMARSAERNPRQAQKFAAIADETLKNHTTLQEAARCELQLTARLWTAAARRVLRGDGCDDEGQSLIFKEDAADG